MLGQIQDFVKGGSDKCPVRWTILGGSGAMAGKT